MARTAKGAAAGLAMNVTTAGQAVGMFVATNVDDVVLLALFFGRAQGDRSATARIVVGQYVGFLAILTASVIGAVGVQLLPEPTIAYLGVLPLLLGLRAAWSAWHSRRSEENDGAAYHGDTGLVMTVATLTFASGGDNVSVYVPVFALLGVSEMAAYVVVFLFCVALCCAIAWYVTSRPVVAHLLARWSHVLVPTVLICVGVVILVRGRAFGL
jgi:cadmium resistance protein CadD (predicted permease)